MQQQTQYACPNPNCRHVFQAHELAGLAAITCPGCRTTFQLRAPTPAAPPPPQYTPPQYAPPPPAYAPPAPGGYSAYPTTQPASYAPPPAGYAQPSYPGSPTAPQSEWGGPPPQQAPADEEPRPRRRRRRSAADLITALVVVGGVLGVLAMVVVGGYLAMRNRITGGDRKDFVSENFLYTMKMPAEDRWEQYDKIRGDLEANAMTLQRKNPAAWFGLRCVDTRGRTPSEDELFKEGKQKLEKTFTDLQDQPGPEMDFAGQKMHTTQFTGQREEENFAGDMLTFHRQGISYWFFFWTPMDRYKQGRKEFEALLARFTFTNRKTQDRSAVREFSGDGYQIHDAMELWEEKPGLVVKKGVTPDPFELRVANLRRALEEDPKADMALVAGTKDERKMASKTGSGLVLILPKAGDPVAAARDYVLAAHKEHAPSLGEWKLEDHTVAGNKERVGEATGHVTAYKLTDGYKSTLLVLGVVPRDDDVLVVRLSCDWPARSRWESEFVRLLEGYKSGPPRDAVEKEKAAMPPEPMK